MLLARVVLRFSIVPTNCIREDKMKKTSTFSNGLIWFGAAISIAEILTGTYAADMGLWKGLAAIFIGHLIGCALLFAAAIMGAQTEKSAMETTKMSFGKYGSYIFSVLNVIQLIGWTAIMIYQGAEAANAIWQIGTHWWSIIIGALIAVWILIGVKNLGILNTVVMTALLALTVVLFALIVKNPVFTDETGNMTFGSALELSVAMPMSWLPLIADYTREAENKTRASLVSVIVYCLTSCFMYVIGFFAAMFTGAYEIAEILRVIGIGAAGIVIVLASTVTTTFLDAYSAGVSSVSIYGRINEKAAGIATCAIGVCLAIFAHSFFENIQTFLYTIAGVFSPMIGVMIADYFILKTDSSEKLVNVTNVIIWVIGFAVYYFCYRAGLQNLYPIVVGYTLPTVVGVIAVKLIVAKITAAVNK